MNPWRVIGRICGVTGVLIACGALAGTVMGRLASWGVWFDNLSSFYPFYLTAAIGAILLILLEKPRRWLGLVVAIAAVGATLDPLQAFTVTALHKVVTSRQPPTSSPSDYSLVFSNVEVGRGDPAAVRQWLIATKPDMAVLVETSEPFLKSLLADEELPRLYPFIETVPSGGAFGLTVMARQSWDSIERHSFVAGGPVSLLVRLRYEGQPLLVIATHALPPGTADAFVVRNEQLTGLAAMATTLTKQGAEVIIAGDLNVAVWSPYYQRLVHDGGLQSFREDHGLFLTWPTNLPACVRTNIDHILFSGGISASDAGLGPEIGSDHLPIWAHFRLSKVK